MESIDHEEIVFNQRILEQAQVLAQSFKAQGIDIAPLAVGEIPDALWVSTDPTKIIGNTQVRADGITYYIGLNAQSVLSETP